MTGFGENLRREREMRGISLQEISETTKISIRLLEALENEEFYKLPGGIFTRSFIRAYANYLGLDEERVLAEYQLVAPPKGEEDFSRIGVSSNRANLKSRIPILPWVIAVFLLAGGYAIFHYAHRFSESASTFENSSPAGAALAKSSTSLDTASSKPPQVLTSVDASNSGSSPAQGSATARDGKASSSSSSPASNPTASSAQTPADASSSASPSASGDHAAAGAATGASATPAAASTPGSSAPTPAEAQAQGEMLLQVAATQPAWVAVDADGKTVLERVLHPNEIKTLMARNYFDVTTGNAQGTVLSLDGVTLKPLGRFGEVKKVHLTRDDLKGYTP
ncbi:MAG TPA: RodZ domain-containing protein [Terriglobia bacterium]|nr:RodZ domain-containing protein [Terriglobia bacterium]